MEVKRIKIEPITPPDTIQITLSEDEAKMLKMIVGGNGDESKRAWVSYWNNIVRGHGSKTTNDFNVFSNSLYSEL